MLQKRLDFKSCRETKGPICIGHNTWVGDKAIFLAGVKVGHGAVIGANAVVTKDIEPFSIAFGNPAKVYRLRFHPDVIDQMLEIKWWDWSFDKMKRNKEFFELDISCNESVDLYRYIVE